MPERNLNFDEHVDRRNTDCLKYDFAKRKGLPEDVLPLWVADIDFKTSSYIEDALVERAKQAIFGYSEVQTPYFNAVSNWMKTHHNWEVRALACKNTGSCLCTCDGSQSIYKAGRSRDHSVSGLLSIFRSDHK